MDNLQTYRVHIVCRSDYDDTHPRTSYYFDYQAADALHALDQLELDDDFKMNFHLQDIVHMDVTDLSGPWRIERPHSNWSASHR